MSRREDFSNSAKSGKILVAKCAKCETLNLALVTFCGKCGSREFSMSELPARGTVATYTIITVAPDGFEGHTPYAWVVMALEGTKLRVSGFMAKIASPDELPVGARARVTGYDERGMIMERD